MTEFSWIYLHLTGHKHILLARLTSIFDCGSTPTCGSMTVFGIYKQHLYKAKFEQGNFGRTRQTVECASLLQASFTSLASPHSTRCQVHVSILVEPSQGQTLQTQLSNACKFGLRLSYTRPVVACTANLQVAKLAQVHCTQPDDKCIIQLLQILLKIDYAIYNLMSVQLHSVSFSV